jgi:hypothetical protein
LAYQNLLPGTKITISGPNGDIVTATDQFGIYDISGLPPGRYQLRKEPLDNSRPWNNTCAGDTGQEVKEGNVFGCRLSERAN